jgi:uncharacterized protein YndB with AHSA1/START domain
MSDQALVEEVLDIDAPREVVFDMLTTVQGLSEWMAVEVQCEPVPGGLLRWRHENGAVMRGRFVSLEPPVRVVFTYGWETGGVVGVPPNSTRVEISLEELAGATRLRLVHSQLTPDVAEEHRYGWRYFFERLAERCAQIQLERAERTEQ